MTRIVFTHLLLFLLPFLAYAFWIVLSKRKKFVQAMQEGPLFWLGVIGLVLVISSLIYTGTFQTAPSGSCYQHDQFIDGELVRGGYDSTSDEHCE